MVTELKLLSMARLGGSPRRARQRGLTLLEIMIATAMIGVVVSTTMFALVQMNQNAAISRLYTGAMAVAQNQIDLLLTDAPFNPQLNQVPPELQPTPSNQATVPIYQDPTSGVVVSGTMSTEVSDVSTTYNNYKLYQYQATVTVNYSYRNRKFSVVMSTIRSSDI